MPERAWEFESPLSHLPPGLHLSSEQQRAGEVITGSQLLALRARRDRAAALVTSMRLPKRFLTIQLVLAELVRGTCRRAWAATVSAPVRPGPNLQLPHRWSPAKIERWAERHWWDTRPWRGSKARSKPLEPEALPSTGVHGGRSPLRGSNAATGIEGT